VFDTNFQTTEFPVKESGGLHDGSLLYVYYRLPNGFGGTEYPAVEAPDWYYYNEFDEYFTGNFVRQFFVADLGGVTYAYFATSLGAFRINSTDLTSGVITNFVKDAEFFSIADSSIYGLAYKDLNDIVLATESGIFVGNLDATNVISGVQRIANTEGINFTRVAVSDNGTYIVALDENAKLYVFKEYIANTYEMKEFPFYTGFPGGVSQMMFLPSSNIFYISGEGQDFASGGFAKINVETQIDWDN
ncbi:MAG: hypothetical protein ACOCYA_00245, partial [Spirochaetota bacterium]